MQITMSSSITLAIKVILDLGALSSSAIYEVFIDRLVFKPTFQQYIAKKVGKEDMDWGKV